MAIYIITALGPALALMWPWLASGADDNDDECPAQSPCIVKAWFIVQGQ